MGVFAWNGADMVSTVRDSEGEESRRNQVITTILVSRGESLGFPFVAAEASGCY